MSLEVFYPQDIRNALLAAEQANNVALLAAGIEENDYAEGFRVGYHAALATIALAFGLVRQVEPVLWPQEAPAYTVSRG